MDFDFSKEAILGRMLSSAEELWGIKYNDNLDPVVRLLMESFAVEIFKVQQNIDASNGRLVEHLAEVLTPTKLTAAVPAHGVMHAGCTQITQVVNKNTSYEITGGTVKDHKFLFTPIDNVKLYHAEVTDVIASHNACRVDSCIYKSVITVPKAGSIPQNHMWLGISVSRQLHDIDGLSFFIDWPNLGSKNDLYRAMSIAKWTVSGTIQLQMYKGLLYVVADRDKTENSFERPEVHELVVNDIKNSYQNQFFTISNSSLKLQENIQKYPAVFENYFSEQQLTQFFTEDKLWVKIELPIYLEAEILNDMLVNTNAFPIINRELKQATTNLYAIPLVCERTERIVSVKEVYGTVNGAYKPIELQEVQESSNTYTFKKAGLERFDRRDAYELVKYLELLLKNEVQAFVSLNKEDSQELTRALNEVVSKTKKVSNSEYKALQYVMLEKEIPDEVVTAEFWVTRCEEANQIRMGTLSQDVSDSSQVGCILLTPTIGGKDSQSETERIRAYQYALLTKEQIVSAQDIKSFIHYQLGEQVVKVDVKSGLVIGHGSKQGLVRSIDVYIGTVSDFQEDAMQRQVVSDALLQKLQQQSDPSRTYRIFWNESHKV